MIYVVTINKKLQVISISEYLNKDISSAITEYKGGIYNINNFSQVWKVDRKRLPLDTSITKDAITIGESTLGLKFNYIKKFGKNITNEVT